LLYLTWSSKWVWFVALFRPLHDASPQLNVLHVTQKAGAGHVRGEWESQLESVMAFSSLSQWLWVRAETHGFTDETIVTTRREETITDMRVVNVQGWIKKKVQRKTVFISFSWMTLVRSVLFLG
jgi:hypothetical protein